MNSQERAFQEFAEFAAQLKGGEKSEGQTFLFHLLEAFGHDSNTLPENCTFENRVHFPGDRTKFADLVWPARVLIEMKSRGAKLSQHYQQTFDYWLNLVPHRPPYVVLCNFDEFWIYDFNTQLHEPVDRLKVSELPARHSALNFLFPRQFAPVFGYNWVAVTRKAAQSVADAFNSMVFSRRGSRHVPADIFSNPSSPCFPSTSACCPKAFSPTCWTNAVAVPAPTTSIGGLFRQMNEAKPARGGRFAGVDYFNGGLFAQVEPIELQPAEIGLLFDAVQRGLVAASNPSSSAPFLRAVC